MEGVDQVDAFIIGRAKAHLVGTMKDEKPRLRFEAGRIEQQLQRNAGPFANRTPPFDAIVPGNLAALRPCHQLGNRKGLRTSDQSTHRQSPVGKLLCCVFGIGFPSRLARAVHAKDGRTLLRAEFLGKRHSVLKASLDREISLFAEREQLSEILILPQRIATAEEASSATDQNVAPCNDHALSPELLAGGGERRNQPVIMERISLTGPARMTSTR